MPSESRRGRARLSRMSLKELATASPPGREVLQRFNILRPVQVAHVLGVSVETVVRQIRNGRLPAYKLGRCWLVRADELERALGIQPEADLAEPAKPAESAEPAESANPAEQKEAGGPAAP